MPAFNAHPGRGSGGSASTAEPTPAMPAADATATRSVVDIVNSLFARFDADGDGSITLSEWLGVVDPEGRHADRTEAAGTALMSLDTDGSGGIGQAEAAAAVSALDSDQDGALSRSERAAAHTPTDGTLTGVEALLGGGPHGDAGNGQFGPGGPGGAGDRTAPDPVTIADAAQAIFSTFDSDASSTIAVSELLAVLDAQGRPGSDTARATAVVTALDSNTDGVLDLAEVTAALTAADGNQDGSIGPGEVGHGPAAEVALIGVLLHHTDMPDGG